MKAERSSRLSMHRVFGVLSLAGGLAVGACVESEAPAGPTVEGLAQSAEGPAAAVFLPSAAESSQAVPGRFVFKGVLLERTGSCPGCTLTLKQGSALVPASAELEYESGGALSFEQLNALMRSGLPLHIRGRSDGRTNTAETVLVLAGVHTVGSIDRSSDDVWQTRAFVLTVRTTPIDFVTSPGALIEPFPAGTEVDVTADIVEGNRLRALRVQVH